MSIMILIPANALSISFCTRTTSNSMNFCSACSSDDRLSSPSVEFEVKRTMDDLIRSASRREIFCSTSLLTSASTSDSEETGLSAVVEDVGAFIGFSVWYCLIPNPNNISSRVDNCLLRFFCQAVQAPYSAMG